MYEGRAHCMLSSLLLIVIEVIVMCTIEQLERVGQYYEKFMEERGWYSILRDHGCWIYLGFYHVNEEQIPGMVVFSEFNPRRNCAVYASIDGQWQRIVEAEWLHMFVGTAIKTAEQYLRANTDFNG